MRGGNAVRHPLCLLVTLGRVLACRACRPWCRGVTKLTGCAWGAMVLCSAPRVAVLVRSGVAMWRPDALLGRPCNVVWCCVAGGVAAVVPRAGAAASVVCDGAGLRWWPRPELRRWAAWVTALASGGAVSLALAPLQRCPGCVVGAASLAV